ncbi:hypothetical protein KY285_026902 [Solanum tuberosum]|nr:hypothetical protein KY285_026902 [Solanum tuberosum]
MEEIEDTIFLIRWWCWVDSEGEKGKTRGEGERGERREWFAGGAVAGLSCPTTFAGGAADRVV